MKAHAIQQIVFSLPPESPYYRRAFRNEPERLRDSNLAERLAIADSDPAFLWNMASAYAAEGMQLPSFVCNSAALRANCFLLEPGHPDYHLARVQSLSLPQMRPSRDVLRGMVCDLDAPLEEVAELCHWALDEVRLFSELCWNFRDRAHEPMYVAQLLYKHTRFPGAAKKEVEEAGPGLRLVRLGYQKGAQAVLRAAGLAPMAIEQKTQDIHGQIQRELLRQAVLGLDMGLTTAKDNPALLRVIQLMLHEKDQPGTGLDDDAIRGLEGMSMGRSLTETFLEIVGPDVQRQLRLQNQQSAEQRARENQMSSDAVSAASTQNASGKPAT